MLRSLVLDVLSTCGGRMDCGLETIHTSYIYLYSKAGSRGSIQPLLFSILKPHAEENKIEA